MKNSELLNEILKALEEKHLNLYHDVERDTVLKHINGIKNIDSLNDMQFDYEMLKIFALFRDAHTTYDVKYVPIDKYILLLDHKFYIRHGGKFNEIARFGKLDSDQMYLKLKEISCYETDAWLRTCIMSNVSNMKIHKMLGSTDVNGKLKVTTANGESIDIGIDLAKLTPPPLYSYKILPGNILYFKFRSFYEIKDYPMISVVKDMQNDIENKNISTYILDLRNNTGGNSEVLNPFQDLVKEKNLKGVVLTNNKTFSSGRIAVERFKRLFGAPIIGDETGGAATSYGNNYPLKVCDKTFTASTRFWDFSKTFNGDKGSVKPDIPVILTLSDYEGTTDVVLNTGINHIKTNYIKSNNPRNSTPTTIM